MAMYEGFIDIPKTSLNKYTGFSMDIGGSLVKLAYVDKLQDSDKADHVRIHMVSYSRENLDEALVHLKERCQMPDVDKDPPEVTTCGVGCHQFSVKINSILHIKQQNINESICFVKAFCFLTKHMPLNEIIHPVSPGALEFLAKCSQQMDEMKRKIEEEKYDVGQELIEDQAYQQGETLDEVLPCLLFMAGSGAAILKVEKDETSTFVDLNTRCGRMFIGLGQILTGAKDFKELISLASAGDNTNVDVVGRDMKTKEEGDIYSTLPDDMMLYCFGKGINGGDFQREDLARSLLSTICQDLCQTVTLCSQMYDMKRVFVCGSFADSHDVIREELTKYFLQRMHVMNVAGKTSSMNFLKFGGYLGAVGALLTDMLK